MKLQIPHDTLRALVRDVAPYAAKEGPLSAIRLAALGKLNTDGTRLLVKAGDTWHVAHGTAEAQVSRTGDAYLDPATLTQALAHLSGTVTVETAKNKLIVREGSTSFRLPVIAPDFHWEPLTEWPEMEWGEMNGPDLARMAAGALCAVPDKALTGVTGSVHLDNSVLLDEFTDVSLAGVSAFDGLGLGCVLRGQVSRVGFETDCGLPWEFLDTARKRCRDHEIVELGWGEHRVGLRVGDREFRWLAHENTFPAGVDAMCDDESGYSCDFERAALIRAVKAASVYDVSVRLRLEHRDLIVEGRDARAAVPVLGGADTLVESWGVHAHRLVAILTAIEGESVRFLFPREKGKPFGLASHTNPEHGSFVLMPVRLE